MNESFIPTGFYAFWFEQILKSYVFPIDSKMDIDLSNKLPLRRKYQNMWNHGYATYSGAINYLKFEQTVLPSRTDYLRCFLYYYCKNPTKWTVKNIIDDDFRLYFNMEDKFSKIEQTFITDLNYILKYSKDNNISFKSLFFTKMGFPDIFKMYFKHDITVFSIVIFQQLFDVFSNININSIGIVEESKLNNIRIIFDKLYKFVYNNNNWKNIFNNYIKSL